MLNTSKAIDYHINLKELLGINNAIIQAKLMSISAYNIKNDIYHFQLHLSVLETNTVSRYMKSVQIKIIDELKNQYLKNRLEQGDKGGGFGEIRTLGRLLYTTFPRLHHRPLGHETIKEEHDYSLFALDVLESRPLF